MLIDVESFTHSARYSLSLGNRGTNVAENKSRRDPVAVLENTSYLPTLHSIDPGSTVIFGGLVLRLIRLLLIWRAFRTVV